MNSILGIINLNEKEDRIREITFNRPIASVPIFGRYRVIDFALSNMVNSGLTTVFIFTRGKYRSLLDHVRGGLPWDLDRRNEGLFIFNPLQGFISNIRSGDMDIIRDYIEYIYNDKSDYVAISPSYMVCNVDYREILNYHQEKNADITVVYKRIEDAGKEFRGCSSIVVEEDRAVDTLYRRDAKKNIFMEIYLMKKSLFLDILNKRILGADHDLFMDTVMKLKSNLKIFAFEYKGYLSCINSMDAYYKCNMELLDEEKMNSLFLPHWPIFTKAKDEPPTMYKEYARVYNSRVSGGTIINGFVGDSILFRKVRIHQGACVKKSILMQNSKVHDNAVVEHTILDKNVTITEGKTIKGTPGKPVVVEKGQII
ncbi:MAG: glucose-1-phosphate adenylyltransferase subunit GlgD [Clostridia bacterium]|nr:glucose-1-phosphate adenylyltransferase subunit GlgD [Clostridia bacterium]